MNNYEYLFSCTSWEQRFSFGLEHILTHEQVSNVKIFEVLEFQDQTKTSTEKALYLSQSKTTNEVVSVSMLDDTKSWKTLEKLFTDIDLDSKKVLIDISTMPRFLIWFTLHFLSLKNCEAHYIYFSPESYDDCDWLSGEPKEPRLIFKHSGLHLPDKNTLLILQTGFDTERVSQLLNIYEPSLALLAVQTGTQYNNFEKNINRHKEALSFQDIETFEIDSFSPDHGLNKLQEKVEIYKDTHNIIMASFGPKPTAIAMFKANISTPEAALIYVPAIEYNPNYSTGIRFDNIQRGVI
ncbi:hypothetical protein [Pseudomonas sp. EA_15y_Pfl1_P104]|uniref:hypothetical protein n=1 Tax=Pseudomonas sp. EA_15y_Pfl1_P104 TaxID=3088686 RepID=UPI0030D853AE